MCRRLDKVLAGAIAAAAAAMLTGLLAQQDEGRKAKGNEDTKGLQIVMGKLIPEGKPILNATIPDLVKGVLKTVVKAASIMRLDDETLQFVAMEVEMYDDEGKPDLSISMETATLDMPTGVLESDRPTQLSNSQFDLRGESFLYDSKKEQGKLFGHVTMYLYNLEESITDEQPDGE